MVEYDPVTEGIKVNLVTDTGSLGDSIDALTVAVLANTVAVNALIAAMAP